MKILSYILLFQLLSCTALCQKFRSVASEITFFSEAPVEDIDAKNKKAGSVFDEQKNEIAFSVPIDEFEFDKSLMQEHFNEKYMESEKFPKSTFTGIVNGYNSSISTKQEVVARGKLTIHGVTRMVSFPGSIHKIGKRIEINSEFKVLLEDYKIKIPKLLWKNIAEEIDVKVSFTYEKI